MTTIKIKYIEKGFFPINNFRQLKYYFVPNALTNDFIFGNKFPVMISYLLNELPPLITKWWFRS